MNDFVALNEEICSRLIGIPVCAVLHDGSRHYGILSKVGGGKLILNDDAAEPGSPVATKRTRSKAGVSSRKDGNRHGKSRRSTKPARLSAYPAEQPEEEAHPSLYPTTSPFSVRVALDLDRIARLIPLL